jgi:indolepyruvate ferredoxin oxidoreductase
MIDGQRRTLSIVSAGKAFLDVRQALADLGIDADACNRLGIRLYKPGLIWPMDRQRLVEFALGSAAVLVVEEKRPVMEDQIAHHLYSLRADMRPALAGKQDLRGAPLLPAAGELTVAQVRYAIKTLLEQIGVTDERIDAKFATLRKLESRALDSSAGKVRPAYFCSGCPHKTSTRIPGGSLALGGIGCHGLVAVVMDRNTMQFMPMGHEGSNWISVGPLVDTPHVFANMDD